MKTDCTIKFNSIEEYREIEKTLEELGYENDKEWNEHTLKSYNIGVVHIDDFFSVYSINVITDINNPKNYNSLKDFLND